MPKKTVFSNPVADESHSRNAFDRSFVSNVNFSAGQLIPTFCQFVFGHSHVRLNQRSFMRTADVNTAAFPSLPMFTDFFFVPCKQILSNWNAFRSRTNDRASSRIGIPARLPAFDHVALRSALSYMGGGMTDDVGAASYFGALRLLDLLGYAYSQKDFETTVRKEDGSGTRPAYSATGDLSPLKLCVYQKIYYDHYRNTAYEANNVRSYSLDDMYTLQNDGTEVLNTSMVSDSRLAEWLNIHYVNARRDFYHTIYPSLNFVASAANGLQFNNSLPVSVINAYLDANGVERSPNLASFNDVAVNVNFNSQSSSPRAGTIFSTQNLRVAFALEKLLRIAAFTPQHVKDQFKARFGYSPRSEVYNESIRLGSFRNDIVVGEVTQTAMIDPAVYNQRLGYIGGKGVGAGDYEKTIQYDVPEDGFIMGVTYVMPPFTYDSNCIDPINQQFVPEDWSLPEFENLGLQPIYAKNISLGVVDDGVNPDTDAGQLVRGNRILGYQPRDMQFKASVNYNHGEFMLNRNLSAFVMHGNTEWLDRIRRNSSPGVSLSYFKVWPSDLNSIFVSDTDGGNQVDDQFYGCITNQFGVIQDKPIFGIPKV